MVQHANDYDLIIFDTVQNAMLPMRERSRVRCYCGSSLPRERVRPQHVERFAEAAKICVRNVRSKRPNAVASDVRQISAGDRA